MDQEKSKFGILLSTVLFFIALVVLILFLIPRVSNLKILSNQVEAKRVEYETGKIKVMNAEDLKKYIEQSKGEANLLGVALPANSSAEDALLSLTAAAAAADLRVSGVEVQDDEKGNLLVSLSTRGTFENSVSLLDKLKNNLRPTKIVDFQMTKTDDDVLTNLSLNLPYYTDSASSVSPTSTATSKTEDTR